MSETDPLISIWVTAGRRDYVKRCLPAFIKQCTYPNYELLISHHAPTEAPETWEFVNDLDFPRKRVFDTSNLSMFGAYHLLLEHSADYHMNIEDDFLFLADPAEGLRDAIRLLSYHRNVCSVRLTSHTPMFVDALNPRFCIELSVVGPVFFGFSISNTQHLTSTAACRKARGLWPERQSYRQVEMTEALITAGFSGVTMLRHWGYSLHIGDVGEDGQLTLEARMNRDEGEILKKYHMFGRRSERDIYSTSLNEEQRREFLYSLYLQGLQLLVPNFVPVTAQARLGPCSATQVC